MTAAARTRSLRARLFFLIVTPLLLIGLAAGGWRASTARATADDVFDRALIAVTLAIARDVAVSGGEALSTETRNLMREALLGEVFYHVRGPDGGFLTGYAYPPEPPERSSAPRGEGPRLIGAPRLYDSRHRGEPVRAARLTEFAEIDGFSGFATVAVWQPLAARDALAGRLALEVGASIALVVLGAATAVWFGVDVGLRPLASLEEAIARRSPDDLGPIQRPVPREIGGVVAALNRLFGQAANALAERDAFISDAAHQLRNPIAGVLALAEAARAAPTEGDRRARVEELRAAAEHAGRVTTQFLTYERAKAGLGAAGARVVDVAALARAACARLADRQGDDETVEIRFEAGPEPAETRGHAVLLAAALDNLIDNAHIHAGPQNDRIVVRVAQEGPAIRVSVSDRGRGLTEAEAARAFERHQQGGGDGADGPSGSGLGLAIVREIARRHGGEARIDPSPSGAHVSMIIPRLRPATVREEESEEDGRA